MNPIDSRFCCKRRKRRYCSMPPAARRIHRDVRDRFWQRIRTDRPDPFYLLKAHEIEELARLGCLPLDYRFILISPAKRKRKRRQRETACGFALISFIRRHPDEMKDLLWTVLKRKG